MTNHYNKENNVVTFKIGDRVSLCILRIDRTCSDLPRLPCVVVGVTQVSTLVELVILYVLYRCTSGLLSSCYPSNELE